VRSLAVPGRGKSSPRGGHFLAMPGRKWSRGSQASTQVRRAPTPKRLKLWPCLEISSLALFFLNSKG